MRLPTACGSTGRGPTEFDSYTHVHQPPCGATARRRLVEQMAAAELRIWTTETWGSRWHSADGPTAAAQADRP